MYNNYNPYYFQPQMQQRVQPTDPTNQMVGAQQYVQPIQIPKPLGLLGKSVDSIEVVKATDIPLDGSISYFPLADGSAIVTKQLRTDGTSKTVIYKPVDDDNTQTPTYVTPDELNKKLNELNFEDIEDELDIIRKDIKDIKNKLKKGD